ncbi:PepSY-associated TM helix domain-containing protein [Colwellia psychrerythraea]|uniref:PepSY domain-containing protein n=1 Tax=Colwellia psychrerythraea TaxID=28229 RepID=A0A099KV78_COLPS|nr:PepSY-associated TM helix domain-containing protein [Colwellia psychrerythraea]KGJ94609.1 hypothetical protein ND2E_1798 [Colwellia psychrerythraea]
MNIRKTLFWLHLIVGCSAAIFIFLMSITGVALTYERQMIQAAEQSDYPAAPATSNAKLPLTKLLNIAKQYPSEKIAQVVVENQPNAPIMIKDGRKTLAYLNPYTGAEIAIPGQGTKTFFRKLRAFHRWLTFDGSFSQSGREINGIANIIFIILILSGLYLWLPKRFNNRAFKQRLTLSGNYPNKRARNYRWHNVFGIYIAPALFIVAVTAIFFSYKWPAQTLKSYASTESTKLTKPVEVSAQQGESQLPIAKQLGKIKQYYPQWQRIQFSLDNNPTSSKIYRVDMGNGGEPQKRISILLDASTGAMIQEQRFEQLSTYSKLRSYIRFLHTGEVFGPLGQTIAGLASLFACLLVYTGVMLSWKRWKNSRKVSDNVSAQVN